MPSAANLKSEKAASAEASDNSPIRQIVTLIEHKIRNLEKRKSKLTSYRDLQKAGKELNSDQKVAVAKYDEVAQTLEFARELAKNVSSIVISAEREAKKQAKKEAWVRSASDTGKIREVLLILDCLTQMGNSEARDDFLNGTNGAAKLTNDDLNILDNLYPEVTPKHEVNEEGHPGFQNHVTKAAEHLYAIIDGKPKEVLGTSYTHIKEIITTVHESGYFDKVEGVEEISGEEVVEVVEVAEVEVATPPAPPHFAPLPPAVPPVAYPLCPLPPITLQEVEHAYFSQQYPQQRPISEVIGSQNFFFLQESEIDSPVGTPQPPPVMNHSAPAGPIPSQTFTNQHFVQIAGGHVPVEPLPPHFPPAAALLAAPPAPPAPPADLGPPAPAEPTPPPPRSPAEWTETAETASPERGEQGEGGERAKGHGDAGRYRRYGGRGGGRPATNGFRNRSGYGQFHRHNNEYRDRPKDSYQRGQYEYQPRHKDSYQRNSDTYYGNGDSEGRDRHDRHDGYKGRSRGAPRAPRGPRPARPQYTRRDDRE